MAHRYFPRSIILATILLSTGTLAAASQEEKSGGKEPEALPTIAEKTAKTEKLSGLLDLYLDHRQGKVWLALPAAGERGEAGRFLYAESLLQGLGSNPVGLDRGQLGDTRLVAFRRVGGRLLVEQLNVRYRASSESEAERRAVGESFATSVLWGGPVAAEDPDGRFLVDFTSFLVRDAHDVAAKLEATGQGTYKLDEDRSVPDLGACLVFPDNVELEAVLTYAGDGSGEHVKQTVPTASSITLAQHHSLVRLPDDGYRPREDHPESGFFNVSFQDYGVPLEAPIRRAFLVRHRLTKRVPGPEPSAVQEPIVFYLDQGTPEPVRSALAEGAGWWAKAFEAAGFLDAFRVEMLPADAHPLDVRYHVIQWVHRSTRGWSYGGGVIDPRTGEMLKGHVNLGSLRVRQDRLLFEGLVGAAKTGSGAADDPVELALARIRQLAAHEVGHALGLDHNFAASTYGRASVMDYPAPLVKVEGGELDLSQAYTVGVGAWDVHAIRYGYGELEAGADEARELASLRRRAHEEGLLFLSDEDARPPGAAHPLANLWDNGPEPLAALRETLAVRRLALARFGEGNVAPGEPLALLQEVLAPVYFHHRYQVEAAVKLVGGAEYTYAHRGETGSAAGAGKTVPVPAARQRAALEALLGLLQPAELDLPEAVLERLLPRPAGYQPNRELFRGRTAPVFDPLAAAASAADLVVSALLQPQRAGRLVDLHRRDPALPGLEEVLEALVAAAFGADPFRTDPFREPRLAEIRREVEGVVARRLVGLAGDASAAPVVRSRAEAALRVLRDRLTASPGTGAAGAHRASLAAEIGRFLSRPHASAAGSPSAPELPPGSPIGGQAPAFPDLGHCSW